MSEGFSNLLSWQFLLFCLSIYAIIFLLRTIMEYFFPNFTQGHLWNNLLLLISPPIIGAILGYYATQYAYPGQLTSVSGRIMFGASAGLFSSFIYRVLKAQLKSTIQGYLAGLLPTGMSPTSASTTVNYSPPVTANTAVSVSTTLPNLPDLPLPPPAPTAITTVTPAVPATAAISAIAAVPATVGTAAIPATAETLAVSAVPATAGSPAVAAVPATAGSPESTSTTSNATTQIPASSGIGNT